MVTIRRIIEDEIDESDIGTFLAEQAKIVKGRGCAIIPRDGEPPFDPVPVHKGDLLYLREEEYMRHGIYSGSPVYVAAVVPDAGVFWAFFLRNDDSGIGAMFFNGTQVAVPTTVGVPRRGAPRLAAEGGRHGP
jgi:hypothetical protein